MPPTDQPGTAAADSDLADLADLVLGVGRLIRARLPEASDAIPMTETERLVMRVVDLHPASTPSAIAARTRLQRTNVSTALRTLEEKGLVTRTSGSGRHIEVHPTPLAATNLQRLRAARAGALAPALGGHADAARTCADLLLRLEAALTTAD